MTDWHPSSGSRISEWNINQPRIPRGMPGGGRWGSVLGMPHTDKGDGAGQPDLSALFPPATQKRIDKVLAFARDNGMEIDYRNGMIDIHIHAEDDVFYRDYTSVVTYYIQRVGKRTVAKRYVPATGEDDVIAVNEIIDDMRRALAEVA